MAPRSKRPDENVAPSNRPTKRTPGKTPTLDQLVAAAGASSCEETGHWAIADAFGFRQKMAQEVAQSPEFKEQLVTALAKEWSVPTKLDALLRPSVGSDSSANDSLVRLLLHVDTLQGDIASGLMQLLPEYQEEEAGAGGVPMVRLILSQFRWLERIVDGAALVETASEIMQVADAPLKREILLVLPDLVEDGQHASAAQTLRAVLAEDTRFLACVLDAFGALVLEEETLAEVCETVMGAVGAANVEDLPVVIRFLLQHMTPSNAKPTLLALRTGMPLDLLGSTAVVAAPVAAGLASARQASGEALVLDALQTAMRLRKEVTALVVRHLEAVGGAHEHSPLDWWLLCAAYTTSAPAERKKVLRLAVDKAASRRLTPSLLRAAIHCHGVALSPHFGSLLEIASGLLQKPTPQARESGELLYVLSFAEFVEVYRRQELLGRLMAHVGSGAPSEVEAALGVLVALATNDATAVHQFAPFLTYILDYLATLTVPQARLAFELFARLAYDGAAAGGSRLTDELLITIRKQLSSSNPHYKCLGLLGGSCMLQRLGVRRDGADEDELAQVPAAASQAAASQLQPPMSRRMADANSLFSMMCKHSANADGTYSFLLHELSHLVAVREPANALGRPLLGLISDRVSSKFESTYLIDAGKAGAATAAVRGLWPKLSLDIDKAGVEGIALNIVPMLVQADGAAALQRHAVSTLSANFQLLRLCEAANADDGESLDAVDAVLGAPLVLFEPRLLGPKLETLAAAPDDTRVAACLALFYAIDWLRELLNGFCRQREPEMRAKVVMRATQLVVLEGVLDACLAVTPHFRLPGIIGDQRAAYPAKQKKPAENSKPAQKSKPAVAKPKPPAEKKKRGTSKPAGSKAAGKRPAVAAGASKKKGGKKASAASDVDSSDGEVVDDGHEPTGDGQEEPAAETGPAGGAGPTGGAAAEQSKRPRAGRPTAPPSLLSLPHLARVRPHLRGISIRTSLILTYGSGHMRKEMDTLDETVAVDPVELTAGAIHFLLQQTHDKVKAAVSSGGGGRGRPAASPAAPAVQDVSSMELRVLPSATLLSSLQPVLLSFRETLEGLHEQLRGPAEVRPPHEEPDHQQALIDVLEGGKADEPAAVRAEYAHASFVLMLRVLQMLLTWEQLHEPPAEAALLEVLAHFGAHATTPEGGGRQSFLGGSQPPDVAMPAAKAETCARAFDFFEALRQELDSPRALAEILDVQRAVLGMQRRLAPRAATEWQRFPVLAAGAEEILRRPEPPAKEDRLGAPAIKAILECQALHTDRPRELIKACAEDWLPSLDDDPRAEPPEEQPFLTLKTASHYLKVMFGLLRAECAKLGLPAPAARLEARALEETYRGFDASAVSAELLELIELFSSLAQSMRGKYQSSAAVMSTVIRESAAFMLWFNARALPFIASQFLAQHTEMIAMLKALQPTTRMLQSLCVDVKSKLQTSSLIPATKLKRELENLLFKVKLMLQQNNCREAFWVGNLKHKNTVGDEVGSQMQVEVGGKKGARKRAARDTPATDDDEVEGDEEEDGAGEAPAASRRAPQPLQDLGENSAAEEEEEEDEDEDEDEDEYPASMLGDDDDDE